jgi:hypothetical protein
LRRKKYKNKVDRDNAHMVLSIVEVHMGISSLYYYYYYRDEERSPGPSLHQ